MFTGLRSQFDFGDAILGKILSQDHDLVKLKSVINWKRINALYEKCFSSERGNATKPTELVIGLILLRHLLRKPDRVLIEELHVNLAIMNFCSVSPWEVAEYNQRGEKLIDHSTLVKVRKRLGSKQLKKIERMFLRQLREKGLISGRHLFCDTTSVEKNIIYPTEVSLLRRVIECGEMIVQKVIKKKDMVKTEIIKRANRISKVYYSASKKSTELLESTSRALLKLAKSVYRKADLVFIESGKATREALRCHYERLHDVGKKILEQVERKLDREKVTDRIVSFFEDHARALPKGKVHRPCEFGVKLRLDMIDGGYISNWRLYTGNPADVGMLDEAVGHHAQTFGQEFEAAAMDRGFYDEQKIKDLECNHDIELAIPHRRDRRSVLKGTKRRLYRCRSAEEAKISESKRMVGLGKSYYKGFEGDEIWTTLSILALNSRQLLRDMRKNSQILHLLTG
jgi:hypothetical protein